MFFWEECGSEVTHRSSKGEITIGADLFVSVHEIHEFLVNIEILMIPEWSIPQN